MKAQSAITEIKGEYPQHEKDYDRRPEPFAPVRFRCYVRSDRLDNHQEHEEDEAQEGEEVHLYRHDVSPEVRLLLLSAILRGLGRSRPKPRLILADTD
jgi:hypothetical protein